MIKIALSAAALLLAASSWAKLPAPSDEAKAKAAETTAKTAHGGKVDAYKLCKNMDQVAATYFQAAKTNGKNVAPAAELAACADPGAFVYPPPAAAAAQPAAGVAAAAVAAAPAGSKAPAAAPPAAAAPKK